MKHIVDARGLSCPLPVVNTKSEIESMNENETVEVIVDNEIAVQNLLKFARVRNHASKSEKIDNNTYKVWITLGQSVVEDDEEIQCEVSNKKDFIVVCSSKYMGSGDDRLGEKLMNTFIFALTKQDVLPSKILFYNSGAYLTCKDSKSLEDLKALESQGVEILTCGTCLDFYEIKDELSIGTVTNMYEIVEAMEDASKVVKP